ncbi:dienelactone hydrolase family protein [Bordetella genomosp. 7]|jgi:carboxymethylenebutenolidase|uniref:Carboxymethylenebutenolidase n=1 Tax=Bordetella genomosp. 7 TaxID=1416805 RepID=A0A261RQG9_9BORD|nr:dienelactone hydrolase family protein [Bordetella genomosp. 7]OZI27215.1 carboxymethylenebutenolidase [Bordetella genomosp. 7]
MSRDSQFDSLLPPLRLDRRAFVVTALATGFTAATGHAAASTAISTSADGLQAGEVQIPVPGGNMPAYRAAPQGGKSLPTVLVISEIFGVHEYIKDVCRRLAKAGYLAIAPELFARQGDASKFTEIARLRAEIIDKVPDAQVMADLDATAAWAAGNGGNPERLLITGFCWGGRIVWLYSAHNPNLRAGAAWYGHVRNTTSPIKPQDPIALAGRLNAPVLGLYGEADAGIPVADVEQMREALGKGSEAAKQSQIRLYKDAPHAFHADYRPSYRKEPAEDAWRRMLDWFERYGG